jgi:rhodanese-related sulfurtransferase
MMQLEGAISFNEFKSKFPSLAKDQEIVFYWAWPKEASAAGQAAKYIAKGYENMKCLAGGVEAWKKAGYPLINSE